MNDYELELSEGAKRFQERLKNIEYRLAVLETRTPKSSFEKPTPQEVQEYAESINFTLDSQNFVDFYESKNWFIGKSKMKDWRAAVRTWKRTAAPKKKTKLFPIGKVCSKSGCNFPAVYKAKGTSYDTCFCTKHLPDDIKEFFE